jgi:hypothetical protein
LLSGCNSTPPTGIRLLKALDTPEPSSFTPESNHMFTAFKVAFGTTVGIVSALATVGLAAATVARIIMTVSTSEIRQEVG